MSGPGQEREAARAKLPAGAIGILDRRSLATANRRLAELLRPGMLVLDAGCGSGAITREIAAAVGPSGRVVGIDCDPELIAYAERTHGGAANLSFEVGDLREHGRDGEFDLVTAARALQWTADPAASLRALTQASRPGGLVQILDYDHLGARWDPPLRPATREFYEAFLSWREDAGMCNDVGPRLGAMMAAADLLEVRTVPQPELSLRGEDGFAAAAGLWTEVAESRGHQIVGDGFLTEERRALAAGEHRAWIAAEGQRQELVLVSGEGVRR